MCCVSVLSPKPSLWWHICMISMGDGEMQSLYITYTISQKLGRSCPMPLSLIWRRTSVCLGRILLHADVATCPVKEK